MSWEWMDLVTEYLNPDALAECRNSILQMSQWEQGVLAGAVFLLAGCALLLLLCGLQMGRYARFVTGLAVGFAAAFVILQGCGAAEGWKLLLYALLGGAACAALNAFLERVFQFAVGFLFGTALGSWLVPEILQKDLTENPGRILRLVIALAAGALFALAAKKLRFLLTALLGGTILGLLIESFVSYEQIPFIPESLVLTEGMYRNILPLVIAGIGVLIQLPQLISHIRTEKELKIPPGYASDNYFDTPDHTADGNGQEEDNTGVDTKDSAQTPERVSIAEAEAVLVEKARELALAAARSADDARLRERYEDVSQGLYSPEAAAERLGISEEEFLKGMKESGFELPGESTPEESIPEENAPEVSDPEASIPEESIPEENAPEVSPPEEISSEEIVQEEPEENTEEPEEDHGK